MNQNDVDTLIERARLAMRDMHCADLTTTERLSQILDEAHDVLEDVVKVLETERYRR